MKKTTLFRRLVTSPDMLQLPCVHDALAARLAEHAGFKAVCVGGFGASASLLGQPDISLLTMTEMADHTARIADCTELPVFADGDTGHGGTANVARTVRLFERAGAAGMFIEDQIHPKRCGHMAGKEVVPRAEMLARIHAALDAREDPDFVIMGRTDALAPLGLEEAVERGHMMQEAGADMIFVEAPTSVEEMRRINEALSGPTFAVYIEGGKTPLLRPEEFHALGYDVVAYGCSSVFTAAHAVLECFKEIRRTGGTERAVSRMIAFDEFNELLGLPEIRKKEKKYAEDAERLARD